MEWTEKENRVAVVALHKCGIERARISVLLKTLNITCVFVSHTVKLFLDTGGVSDHKRSGQPRMVRTPQVNNRNSVLKQKNHGYCIENHELHYQTRLGTFK